MDARDQVRCRGRCCVAQANARDVGLVGVEVGAGGQRGAAREGCREELALVGAPGKAQSQVITPAGVIGEDVCSQGLDDRADRQPPALRERRLQSCQGPATARIVVDRAACPPTHDQHVLAPPPRPGAGDHQATLGE